MQQSNQYAGRVAVVTGAGSGVGEAIAHTLAQQGICVALLGRTEAKLRQVQTQIRAAGGKAECFPCDVSDHEQVSRREMPSSTGSGRLRSWLTMPVCIANCCRSPKQRLPVGSKRWA